MDLRPYQAEIIYKCRNLMKQGCRSILVTAPTGSGKTLLTAHMLKTAASKGLSSLFICHRRELIFQTMKAFDQEGLKYGIISAGYAETTMPVQIASVQTLARRLNRQSKPSLIVWDECHHIAASCWEKIFRRFQNVYHIGLTATPSRLDGRGLGGFFKELVQGPSVQTLIEQGYLSPYKLYAPMRVSTEGVHTKMGDFVRSELASVMDKPSITGDAVAHYKKYCNGKRAIVFAVSIQHSKNIVEKFRAEGINAEHVDGETEPDVRDRAIQAFKEGSVQVLSNVELFGEGFDLPAMEACILLRPTQSLSLYLQQVGRALRPFEGKTAAVILDHVGNYARHGLPDDPREWSLEGHSQRSKSDGSKTIGVKICPSCFAAQRAGSPSCKFCGFTFEVTPRKVQEKEGELSEVDQETARSISRRTQGMAESLEDLINLGKQRRYKNPYYWAKMIFNARQARRIGKYA